jgi:hypothetical protein
MFRHDMTSELAAEDKCAMSADQRNVLPAREAVYRRDKVVPRSLAPSSTL